MHRFLWLFIFFSSLLWAKADESKLDFSGLKFRAIGPALTSGRISDIAVHPENPDIFYVASSSGGVWKTVNHGTTFQSIFDHQGSYSIGVMTIDPKHPDTIWVGTGENNSQRSVSYGDGVYKSTDGGQTWKHMGLKDSEHIGKILVDPDDSNTVYVASQGPLWRAGGDRGLYKTTDGGLTWHKTLTISEHTGVNEVLFQPGNPDVMYASTYQRRRHTWVLINGGPESAIYKSTDRGETWQKLSTGLPKGDMGRIGLAVTPAQPKTVYAIIEALGKDTGFYRSDNAGASWKKMSDYVAGSPQYYNEIVADPNLPNRVYAMDTFMHVTEDGGKNFEKLPEKYKHVDNHALWINPDNSDHLLAGCDGGLYETWDRGQNWRFYPNLPVIQFYRSTPDNDFPFYNVYGGTQDNFSLGGPSRTTNVHGIRNEDWFITLGGDGYKTQIDPSNPDIVYSQLQYGVLVRYDRRTGERIGIQPQEGEGEPALRWNWDSPLIISPHNSNRLYFGANKLFRSDDQGNTWTAISDDLTRQIDRNKLPVMGRVWGVDTVAKNASTSFYGNLFSLAESPVVEGLIYAGTDDGLIQITEDGGKNWRKLSKIKGVPEGSYIADLDADLFDANTVYAAFRNHKQGDFKPYIGISRDRGRKWTLIQGDLPERGSVHTLAQDHVEADLLFAGTEFGLFFSQNAGKNWHQLKGNLPVVAVRDLEIQRRENDLVLGTFGRGIFILDDYSPLRASAKQLDTDPFTVFPIRDSWMYIEEVPLGLGGKSFQGETYYTADNPPYGTVIQYFVNKDISTLKKVRQKAESKKAKAGEDTPYPSWDDLRQEDQEESPVLFAVIRDAEGQIVKRIKAPTGKGFQQVVWNHRYPASTPVRLKPWPTDNPFSSAPEGPLAMPGIYSVSFELRQMGQISEWAPAQTFKTSILPRDGVLATDRASLLSFQQKVARLQSAVLGSDRLISELDKRLKLVMKSLDTAPNTDEALQQAARSLQKKLRDMRTVFRSDSSIAKRNEPTPPGLIARVQTVVFGLWDSTSLPTQTMRDQYDIAARLYQPLQAELKTLVDQDLASLEANLNQLNAPWTPGRVPAWQSE